MTISMYSEYIDRKTAKHTHATLTFVRAPTRHLRDAPTHQPCDSAYNSSHTPSSSINIHWFSSHQHHTNTTNIHDKKQQNNKHSPSTGVMNDGHAIGGRPFEPIEIHLHEIDKRVHQRVFINNRHNEREEKLQMRKKRVTIKSRCCRQ